MKGKGGPSFFDVLRTTMKQELNPPTQVEEGAGKETPATAAAIPPAAIARLRGRPAPETPPEPPIPVETAKPIPPATPAMSEGGDPDRKMVQVSQTAVVFGLLIGMIVLLMAFYAGIRVGRTAEAASPPEPNRAAAASVPPAQVSEAPAPASAPVPSKETSQPPAPPAASEPVPKFTIHVMWWPAGDRTEKERADRNAAFFANYLSEKGFEDLAIVPGKGRVTLYMGKFVSNTAPEARKVLDAVRAVQYSTGSNPPKRIFQGADFAPISQRQP